MKTDGCFNCGARYGNMCRLEEPQKDITELSFCPYGNCKEPQEVIALKTIIKKAYKRL